VGISPRHDLFFSFCLSGGGGGVGGDFFTDTAMLTFVPDVFVLKTKNEAPSPSMFGTVRGLAWTVLYFAHACVVKHLPGDDVFMLCRNIHASPN